MFPAPPAPPARRFDHISEAAVATPTTPDFTRYLPGGSPKRQNFSQARIQFSTASAHHNCRRSALAPPAEVLRQRRKISGKTQ
jgi:hypothetical protein